MKQIIRVEHTDGQGMFFGAILDLDKNEISERDTVYEFLPDLAERHGCFRTPSEDDLDVRKDRKIWYCAYKSMDQFNEWCRKDEIKDLLTRDYKVLILDVTEYQEGKDQIIYTKESIVSSKDISELYK